jgi:hypothetical protein
MECKLVRSDDEIDIFIHQEIELIGCMRILSWVHTYHTIAHAHAVSLGAIDDEAQHDIISLPPSECPIRNCRRMRGRLHWTGLLSYEDDRSTERSGRSCTCMHDACSQAKYAVAVEQNRAGISIVCAHMHAWYAILDTYIRRYFNCTVAR